jgi:hypothetical protein
VHQARDGVFQLAPVDDHRGVHREVVVLARVVDVQMGVQHVAHVAHPDAMVGQLPFDHVLVELQAAHPQRLHDRVVAVAGVDDDGVAPAEDEKAVDRHAPGAPAIAPEDEEARFELDVAVVEHPDFQSHSAPPCQVSR